MSSSASLFGTRLHLGAKLGLLLLCLFTLFISGCVRSVSTSSQAARFLSSYPEPVEIHRPKPESFALKNGLTVLFLPDDELPIVSGSLFISAGSFHEPSSVRGVVGFMGSMLRLGGTERLGPDELDERLRELSAEIGSSFGTEYGSVSFQSLSSDFEEVFELFSQVVLSPRFDESRFDLQKTQAIDGIRRRGDNPGTVASITADYLLYKDSPLGGVLTSEEVQKITRLDLLRSHRELVRPDGAFLVVTGASDLSQVKRLVAASPFARWEPRGGQLPSIVESPKPAPPAIYYVRGPFTQATVYFVQSGPERHTEDQYAIRLMNNIFGDGMDSRLMKSIRTDLGLAYSVYGMVSPGHPLGTNTLYIQTKTESLADAVARGLEELELLRKEAPAVEEVKGMQHAAEAGFVFRFTSPGQILERMVLLKLLGYPDDFDEHFSERIFAVSPEEVRTVAERWWKPDDFRVVVVSNGESVGALKAFAAKHPLLSQYKSIDLTFNEIPRGVSW